MSIELDRRYRDANDTPRTLHEMIMLEPDWAESRFRHMEQEIDRLQDVWTCEGCGAIFPRVAHDKDVTRCTRCVEVELLREAIERGGMDVSPCMGCGEMVVCVPDGMPMCEQCGKEND